MEDYLYIIVHNKSIIYIVAIVTVYIGLYGRLSIHYST